MPENLERIFSRGTLTEDRTVFSSIVDSHSPEPGCRVLVVDDDVDNARVTAMLLVSWGYDATLAHNPATALSIAAWFLPQMVLLDLGLPDMDGFEVAARIRALSGMKHATILAVTAHDRPDDRARCLQAGFRQHLLKPVDPPVLREVVESVLRPRQPAEE